MGGFAVSVVVGIVCILLGISNMRGDISSLHSYHRHRVSEEDKKPFGKMVGLGTIIVGGGVAVSGILYGIVSYNENKLLSFFAPAIMISAIVIGLGISLYAIVKYNKGIF